MNHSIHYVLDGLTGRFAAKPTHCQSGRGLVNSRTS